MVLKQLRDDIAAQINNSRLPIDAVFFVIKDLYNEINYVYQQEIEKEEKLNKDDIEQNKQEKNENNVEHEES